MEETSYNFGGDKVAFYFEGSARKLSALLDKKRTVLLSDENIAAAHPAIFKGWKTIIIKSGEEEKNTGTVERIISALLEAEADRSFVLVGIGGGVITDLAGYVATIYMRGIGLAFVPTSLLAMVDAAVGGKNGINHGVYKNMVGTIRQPSFIIYDSNLLSSLPDREWINGFAEIIKHAAIADASMFNELEGMDISAIRKKKSILKDLIRRNVEIKAGIVAKDVTEQGDRKLLNFGHTLGHAIEIHTKLMHGEAIAVGMCFASQLSENFLQFKDYKRVENLLAQYELPVRVSFRKEKIIQSLVLDKKRKEGEIQFILLKKIGKAIIHHIPISTLTTSINES